MKAPLLLSLLLTACATTGQDPFCVKVDDRGTPMALIFKGSRQQAMRFNRTSSAAPVRFSGKEAPARDPAKVLSQ